MRAGPSLGLPLMVAIIGGETHRFKPLIDSCRESGKQGGYSDDQLKAGCTFFRLRRARGTKQAADDFFPGYSLTMTEIGKERGWPKMTRDHFEAQMGPQGALIIGEPDEVIQKIVRHSKALGGISRITFMMNPASLPHEKLMRATELIGTQIAPALREELDGSDVEVS